MAGYKGYPYIWSMARCEHKPKFVKVGGSSFLFPGKVFLCGKFDLEEEHLPIIAALDVFIGMCNSWEKYLPKTYSNPILRKLSKILSTKECLPNLFVHEVRDGGVDEELAKAVITLFKEGLRIGFGCLSGHGRTGWLLGKLIREIEGIEGKELVEIVRERWCKKAIESIAQFSSLGVDWMEFKSEFKFGFQKEEVKKGSEEAISVPMLQDWEGHFCE